MAGRVHAWLRALFGGLGDPRAADAQRRTWSAIAERHGLAFMAGPDRNFFEEDRLDGWIEGRDVRVISAANYDVQNLEVRVSVECEVDVPADVWLARGDLVAWYEARRGSADLPPIDAELEPWVLGKRLGIGAELTSERRLVYRQLYTIDEATLELVLAKLPRWAVQLERASQSEALR